MFNSINIANYFVEKSIWYGSEMTPMKLLKLTYIAHGWFLGINSKPLINEQAEAWQYGPVIRSVYDAFKHHKTADINKLEFHSITQKREYEELKKDEDISSFLDSVWEVYKDFNGMQLSDLTHQNDTPWSKTVDENGGFRGNSIISNKSIAEHYQAKMKAAVS